VTPAAAALSNGAETIKASPYRHERTVLTTGANSGIGLATVMHVAGLGFRSVGSVRSEAKAGDGAQVVCGLGQF